MENEDQLLDETQIGGTSRNSRTLPRVLIALEILAVLAWILAIVFKIASWVGANEILLYSAIALAIIMMLWRRVYEDAAISVAAIGIAASFLGSAGILLSSPWGSTVRMAGMIGCAIAAAFLIYRLFSQDGKKLYLFWLARLLFYGVNPTWLIFTYLL